MDDTFTSIVEYTGLAEEQRCTYCNNTSSRSHGMWSESLNVTDYQDLIDRGWRRRGQSLYKPTMDKTCCPPYTIRLDAMDFKLSKSHKKVLKQMNKYLIYGHRKRPSVKPKEDKHKLQAEVGGGPSDKTISEPTHITKPPPKAGVGADPSKPLMRKAKFRRSEKKRQRDQQRTSTVEGGVVPDRSSVDSVSLGDTKAPVRSKGKKKLEDFIDEPDKAQTRAHKFEIRLIRPTSESEDFIETEKESAAIFQQYRTEIHNYTRAESGRDDWLRFLVHSPLKDASDLDRPPLGYGTFHQHYILDGTLVAVGVLDILPLCVQASYLYYLPEYRFLSIGTYTALREIALVRKLNKSLPNLRYYYLGYYVHSCSKLEYKTHFTPSSLLCPETYTWHLVANCLPKLDISEYSRLATDNVKDVDRKHGVDEVDDVSVLFRGQMMSFGSLKSLLGQTSEEKEVTEYAYLVGKKCARKLILVRSQ
ncbi:arginyl-tRNA--protein transferase 1-like [Argopecten irradians]|uniref:arginyl-tRNA--protein transferase 1-like n=1 Tax=Argopecten irradians TaxID=31199 RepID=UPI0037229378